MSTISLILVLCVELVQSATSPTNSVVYSDNPPYTRDFELIESLGQAKDSAGLEHMAADLKARWKDVDMDCYCRLMYQLLGHLRTDFDPVDYVKLQALSEGVLAELEKEFTRSINPVLVPYYCEYQIGHISLIYGTKYYYTAKGDKDNETWLNQRRDVMIQLLKVWRLIQNEKDSTWDINDWLPMNVDPPNGAPTGISPESIKDPNLRAKYEDDIQKNAERHKSWRIQYEIWKTEGDLKRRLLNDIKVMYNTPPLAPDELKSLLDTYVKDEEQRKMFLEASQK